MFLVTERIELHLIFLAIANNASQVDIGHMFTQVTDFLVRGI